MHGGIIDSIDINAADGLRLAWRADLFWHFRVLMHPTMLQGWFQYDVAQHLQQFFIDFKAGKRPKMLLSSPPQHGKSNMMVDFVAWMAGQDPNLRTMFASYSDSLGERANADLQRVMDNPMYKACFYYTNIPSIDISNETSDQRYKRNSSLIEFIGFNGSFRNTTVNGQITGFGLDLGVIDDPIKGRAEASSPTNRDKTWNWLTDDFFSRFSNDAGMVMIATRWHIDDPLGRWMERFPETTVLKYPAIAEVDDPPYRKKGEALGQDPNLRTMFASYSDSLGERANADLQRVMDNPTYKACFYYTNIPSIHISNETSDQRYKRNSSLIEFVGFNGSFRNTTVNGQITGFGLDLGVIDDPIKGRAEASSPTNRDKTWNWLTDDFFSRFSNDAGMVMIATRWHIDDPLGRWMGTLPRNDRAEVSGQCTPAGMYYCAVPISASVLSPPAARRPGEADGSRRPLARRGQRCAS